MNTTDRLHNAESALAPHGEPLDITPTLGEAIDGFYLDDGDVNEEQHSADLMLRIKALDPSTVLELSEWTGKWYVSARIEISDGAVIGSITEHCDSPEQAIRAFFDRLTAVPLDQVIVTNANRDERRHWRWNGAAFAEEPLSRFDGSGMNG